MGTDDGQRYISTASHSREPAVCRYLVLGFRHSEILDPRGGQVGSSSGTFRAHTHSVQLGSDEHQCESQVVVIVAGSYIVSFKIRSAYHVRSITSFLSSCKLGWTGCMMVFKQRVDLYNMDDIGFETVSPTLR